jgi:hypothetical protein
MTVCVRYDFDNFFMIIVSIRLFNASFSSRSNFSSCRAILSRRLAQQAHSWQVLCAARCLMLHVTCTWHARDPCPAMETLHPGLYIFLKSFTSQRKSICTSCSRFDIRVGVAQIVLSKLVACAALNVQPVRCSQNHSMRNADARHHRSYSSAASTAG